MGLLPLFPVARASLTDEGKLENKAQCNHGQNPALVTLVEELFACCKVGAPKLMPVCQVLIPCYM